MGNTFGILSLIFALLGLCVTWLLVIVIPFWGPLIFPILAIILGIVGIIKDDSNGLAIAGLVIGIIALVCWGFFGVILLGIFLVLLGLSAIA